MRHSEAANIRASARGDVPPFMVMDVMAAAARLEATGARVVHMEVGQPAAGAPATARHAAAAALASGGLGSTSALGRPSLRARIARHYAETFGIEVDPERVIATTGSSGAFVLAFLSLFEAGARVAITIPGYPPYRHILKSLNCIPVEIETTAATRWALTPEALMAAHAETPLKGVLVASPANPTGTMMSEQALSALIATAEDAGIAFISDEIYHGLDYAFAARSAAGVSERALVINSFSKYFCMTGWRVGWMVAPPELVRPIERLQQNLAISVPTLSQIAAEAAFDGRDEMEAVKAGYEVNRRMLVERLPASGLDVFLPADGAFYLYADVSRFTNDSHAFAQRLLAEAGVAATPGADFDPITGGKFIRFCYAGARDDIELAITRMDAWLRRL